MRLFIKYPLLLLFALLLSCSTEDDEFNAIEESMIDNPYGLVVRPASAEVKAKLAEYLASDEYAAVAAESMEDDYEALIKADPSISARISKADFLKRHAYYAAKDTEYVNGWYSIPNVFKLLLPGRRLNFKLDNEGGVYMANETAVSVVSESKKIVSTEVHDFVTDGIYKISDDYRSNHRTSSVIRNPGEAYREYVDRDRRTGKGVSVWECFDGCIGDLHGPFKDKCQTCNFIFGTVAEAATFGLYGIASLGVCGTAAVACLSD